MSCIYNVVPTDSDRSFTRWRTYVTAQRRSRWLKNTRGGYDKKILKDCDISMTHDYNYEQFHKYSVLYEHTLLSAVIPPTSLSTYTVLLMMHNSMLTFHDHLM